MHPAAEPMTFEYAIEPLPPGRLGHRWRWELWDGVHLLGAGWTTSPRRAERAVRTAASRRAHWRLGLRALRPERNEVVGTSERGLTLHVDCGAVTCVLEQRAAVARRRAAAA